MTGQPVAGNVEEARRLAGLAEELEKAAEDVTGAARAQGAAVAALRSALTEAVDGTAAGLSGLAAAVERLGAGSPAGPDHPPDDAVAALRLLGSEAAEFREATERAFAEAAAGAELEAILAGLGEVDRIVVESGAVGLATSAAESVLALAEQFGGRADSALAPVLAECDQLIARRQAASDRPAARPFDTVVFPAPAWARNVLSSLRRTGARVGQADELRRELEARGAVSRSPDYRLVDSSSPLLRLGVLKDLLRRIKDVTDFINPYD